jgi:hypothetical protein
MSKKQLNVAKAKYFLFALPLFIGLYAVVGLWEGIFDGAAEWCTGRRHFRHCKTILANDNYSYVQDMITLYWFLLAFSIIATYISHRIVKSLDRK